MALRVHGRLRLSGSREQELRGDGSITSEIRRPYFRGQASALTTPGTISTYIFGVGIKNSRDILHDLNTGKFTVLQGGSYHVNIKFQFNGNAGHVVGELFKPYATVNPGVFTSGGAASQYDMSATLTTCNQYTWVWDFKAGDTFFVGVPSAGGAWNAGIGAGDRTTITIVKIGESGDGRSYA
jgi:hypothetical protein